MQLYSKVLTVLQLNYVEIVRLYHRTLHCLEILTLPLHACFSLSRKEDALLKAQPFKKLAVLEPAI